MNAEPTEVELKFLIDEQTEAAVLGHPALQGEEKTSRMESVYFDTPDQDLRRKGFGLRVRDTGEGYVQTVKQSDPARGPGRGEWERKIETGRIDAAALAATPAAQVLDGSTGNLAPVFSTTIERRARQIERGGARVEAAIDRGEVSSGEHRAPIRELELELKDGEPAALFELARAVSKDLPLALSFESKAEQGYRLVEQAALDPRPSVMAPLDPKLAAAQAFQRIARACLAQACANAALLRAIERPEAVHQMRVGLRRLRAAIKTFEAVTADEARTAIDDELKWLAHELDDARDLDVFMRNTFGPELDEAGDEGLAGLGKRLLEAQTAAYQRAERAVRSTRCSLLMVETAGWIETGRWTRGEDPVVQAAGAKPAKAFASDALDHLRKVVRRRGRNLKRLDPLSRHKLRIRAKRLRYGAEFFSGLYPEEEAKDEFLQALEGLQDRLGELNDIEVARSRMLQLADLGDPQCAFAAGRIVGLREHGRAKLIGRAANAYERLIDAPRFWRD